MIPQSFIDDIQAKTDIVELIRGYIPIKRAGRNFKALCPFHGEKTPSFMISPQKQIFHCFGCGEGGGAIQFVMLIEKVSFPEAIEILARQQGVKVPNSFNKPLEEIKTKLYAVLGQAGEFFAEKFSGSPQAEPARQYMFSRGFNEETIKKFKIGYAPPGSRLMAFMIKKNFNPEILEKASLITSGKGRGYSDMFHNRIMFPIFDTRGRVLGFGARALEDGGSPKYINSPETEVYKKRENLYGLNFAWEEIVKKDYVLVVEGYLDMITPFSHDIKNIVASLGTALTIEQVNLLRRYTKNIVLVFDSDKAGERATLRAMDLLIEQGLNIGIAQMPAGYDPDSLVRRAGKEGFLKIIENRIDFFDYKLKILKTGHDLGSIAGKSCVAREMLLTISKLSSEIEKYEYVKRLSAVLRVREEVLLMEQQKLRRPGFVRPREKTSCLEEGPVPIAEKMLVQFMLSSKKAAKVIMTSLDSNHFSHPLTKKTMELLSAEGQDEFTGRPEYFLGAARDAEVVRFVSRLLMGEDVCLDKNLLKDCIYKLKDRKIKESKAEIRKELREAELKKDKVKIKDLIIRYKELSREVKKYG